MTIEDFANQFNNPCSLEDLFSRKEELLECDYIDEDILNGILSTIQKENVSLIDRGIVTKAIVTYLCTTGDFGYFTRNLLKELLLRDGCSMEATRKILIQADRQATKARRKNRDKQLEEQKRKEDEKRKKEEDLKKLEESIDMSKTAVSYDTARFLIRNGTTYEALAETLSVGINSQEDIDPILYKYRISSDGEKERISIADVVGYDYSYMRCGNDLFKAFSHFFDSTKMDGYHTRSLSMLDLTTDNAMEILSDSFQVEPMKVADAPGHRYTVNGNGMHRYSVLRSLYLIEMARAEGNQEQEKAIREKYTLPALVSKIDYIKTYSNFVLSTLKETYWLGNERDEMGVLTGRAKLELVSDENLYLTNEELIAYVRNTMILQKDNPTVQWLLQRNDSSFHQFLSLVVPEMLEGYKMEEEHVKIA